MAQRRLTLLYQLFLASSEARRFMRGALRGTGMSGEEYGIYSYFYANGPRTLSQAATDLGYPLTTLASLLAPAFEAGDLRRRRHPTDGRARLIEIAAPGRARMDAAIPTFSAAYQRLVADLVAADADVEALFAALETLRAGIADTTRRLEEQPGEAADG